MEHDPHPSSGATVGHIIRLQMARRFPLETVDAVAAKTGLSRHSLHSWRTDARRMHPETLREVLTRLGADEITIVSALVLLSGGTPGGQ